jgi:hypothetical protein
MDKNSLRVILSVVSLFIAGCGGGGSNGGLSSSSQPEPQPAIYLLFSGGSIWAVDPSNPSLPLTVESGQTEGEAGVLHANWDPSIPDLTEGHLRTVLYASSGKIFKVSTLKSDPPVLPAPIQVSNETTATGICDAHAEFDFNDHNNAVYIYELPGSDNDCGIETDNVWKMVRVGMKISDNPIVIKKVVETLYNFFSLAIDGFLAVDGTNLVRCDPNFKVCNVISSFTNTMESLQYNPFVGVAVLQIDDKLYTYDVLQGGLSPSSRHTLSGAALPSIPSDMDATHF